MLRQVCVMANFTELFERLKQGQMRLNHELQQLKAEEKSADEQREGSPFGKREEGATEAFELEKRMALERRLTDALVEVEHALKKYEAGTYGICDLCGRPIEPARLEALPQANLCLECKARQAKNARSRTAR
ncbi:MAG: TraR/DksA C4-type zinc finger protein [Chloroflexi bacterium]|nr:TraR/DksA C4-type zinc finger protein [Chloroflexota bacterium]